MMQVLLAGLLSLGLTAAIGPAVIRWLRKMRYGQQILEDGPTWHMKKQGTPTMGGVMFIAAIFVASIVAFAVSGQWEKYGAAAVVLGFGLLNALIGLLDDWRKIRQKQNKGLSARQKLVLQVAAAILCISVLRVCGFATPQLTVPFLNIAWHWNWVLYILFMAFVMVGTVNAVNLTDGLDGLAAGVTLPVAVFFAAAALLLYGRTGDASLLGVAEVSGALAGGMIGFLIFNFYPAKVFMGDTGSLFLGAMVCALAFAIDLPIILLPVGFWYILEAVSVILQVCYFKLTHGKRLFKMAPIHHHFEKCGYSERQIVCAAFTLTLAMCAVAYWGVMRM